MASSALPSLLLVILAISAFSAAARPCKTVFFYTTTTTSFFPINPQDSNANPKLEANPTNSPKFLALFFTTVHTPREVHDRVPLKFYFPTRPGGQFSFRSYPFPRFNDEKVAENQAQPELPAMPVRSYESMTSGPISERTRDILSAVGAMLFGVGCGSLTAATMYLVWSLTSRFGSEEESDDEGFNGEDDDNSTPKKVGYVAIPDDDIAAIKKAAQEQAKIEATGN